MSKRLTFNDRASVAITAVVSGMPFFWWSCLGIAAWMAWNAFAPTGTRFDPGPAFVLLLMVLNIGQWLFLSALGNGQAVLARSHEARDAHEAMVVDRLDGLLARVAAMEEVVAKEQRALRSDVRTLRTEVDLIAQGLEGSGHGRRGEGAHARDHSPDP